MSTVSVQLYRQDLLQVGPVSSRDTLALLPASSKKRQRVVLGDDTGSVTCFESKRSTPTLVFKSLPDDVPISAMALGGPLGKKDKVFVSSGQQIKGLNPRKGKEFFRLHTNLTESIRSMFVEDARIWTAGELIFNLFEDGKDVALYMCPDVINALLVDNITRDTEYDVVLGCKDNHIRVYISGEAASMELTVDGPVTTMAKFSLGDVSVGAAMVAGGPKQMVYGTQTGRLAHVLADASALRRGWEAARTSKEREAAINALSTFDFTKDGTPDVVVARDDGTLQVYNFDDTAAHCVFAANAGESLRSVSVGHVQDPEFAEVVTSSFSGKVVSYTTEAMEARDTGDAYGRKKETVAREAQIGTLKRELEALKGKVASSKERFEKSVAEETVEYIPMEQQFTVNASFMLDPEEAAYTFSVEIPLPIDAVCLQSFIPVDLLEVESNGAILSRSPPDRDSGNMLLATYRCDSETPMNRLEMKARTVEGQYGDMEALVIADMSPGKTAQSVKFTIKPLSLHHRVHTGLDSRPMNSVSFTGGFTRGQIHEWVAFLLPDVPSKPSSTDGDFCDMAFRNVFLGTQLSVRYKKGEATFLSDSMSTVAIVKEVITKLATSRKIRLSLGFDIRDETVPNFLKLVDPKLVYTLSLSRKVEIVEALNEIRLQTDTSFLSAEYIDVLENAEQYKREFKNQPRALEMLFGLITDLFVDKHKFKGHNVAHRIPELMTLLHRYDYDEVVSYFGAPA